MADKVYYEVEGEMTIKAKVKLEVVVRTEDGSKPQLALEHFLKTGETEHQHGSIEVSEADVDMESLNLSILSEKDTEKADALSDAVAELIGVVPLKKTKINLIDAK